MIFLFVDAIGQDLINLWAFIVVLPEGNNFLVCKLGQELFFLKLELHLRQFLGKYSLDSPFSQVVDFDMDAFLDIIGVRRH